MCWEFRILGIPQQCRIKAQPHFVQGRWLRWEIIADTCPPESHSPVCNVVDSSAVVVVTATGAVCHVLCQFAESRLYVHIALLFLSVIFPLSSPSFFQEAGGLLCCPAAFKQMNMRRIPMLLFSKKLRYTFIVLKMLLLHTLEVANISLVGCMTHSTIRKSCLALNTNYD